MDLTKNRFAGFNRYLACQALVYFQDAEEKQTRELQMLEPVDWEAVKKYFINEVADIRRKWSLR